MDIIRNNIKKIIPIFLLSIMIFTIPVSARWAYINCVETITTPPSNAKTTKERCLHYARRIMGHNAIFSGSSNVAQEVWLKNGTTSQKYKQWIDTIFNEIANGRPIILSAKKRNSNQVYHWVLAYQFGIYKGKKEYQTLTIRDPITNQSTSANNYQFQYRYIKIKASHLWDEGKRRNEIVNFAKKFIGYKSRDIYNHIYDVYTPNSIWVKNESFGTEKDWCCYFVNFVYNRCGMDPYAIKYESLAIACTDNLMYQAKRNYKFRYKEQYTPQKGDIIFFDYVREKTGYRRDRIADHVGIVDSVRNGIVCTIEGNTGNNNASYSKVNTKWYYLNDANILGYLNPYA